VQRMCGECADELRRQPMEEEEEGLQVKAMSGRSPEVSPDLGSRMAAVKGGGQPLPRSLRSFFEPRFGYNFGHVRIHTDAPSAELARAVRARFHGWPRCGVRGGAIRTRDACGKAAGSPRIDARGAAGTRSATACAERARSVHGLPRNQRARWRPGSRCCPACW
jgi:hypothetical protein